MMDALLTPIILDSQDVQSGASKLLRGELQGLAIDANYPGNGQGSITIKDLLTSTNLRSNIGLNDARSPLVNSGTSPKMIEISPAVTTWTAHNLAIRSEELDNAAWSTAKFNLSVAANNATDPNGTITAETFTDDATDALHLFRDIVAFPAAAEGAFSIYAKAGTHSHFIINYSSATTVEIFITQVFDLSDGTLGETDVGTTSGTISSASIESVGNGWYRCTLVGSISHANGDLGYGFAENKSSNTFGNSGHPTYAGSSETLHLWGAQLNRGSVATAYIPTTTTASGLQVGPHSYEWSPHNFIHDMDAIPASVNTASWQIASAATTDQANMTADDGPTVTITGQYGNLTSLSPVTAAGVTYTIAMDVMVLSGNTALHINHTDSATGANTAIVGLVQDSWVSVSVDVLGKTGGGVVQAGVQDRNAAGHGTFKIRALRFTRTGGTPQFWLNNATSNFIGTAISYDQTNSQYGILVEPAATNLLAGSQGLSDTATLWTEQNITVVDNAVVAPDGTTTAETWTDDATSAQHQVYAGITLATTTDAAFSVFAKAGTHNFVVLNYQGTSENFISAVFDLSDTTATTASEVDKGTTSGTVTLGSTKQERLGTTDWYRLTMVGQISEANRTFTVAFGEAATSNSFNAVGAVTYAGTGTTLHLWQAQAEVGTLATSPIPTYAATVTRAADDVNILTNTFAFGAIYSFLFEYTPLAAQTSGNYVFGVSTGTNQDYASIYNNGGTDTVRVVDGGAVQASLAVGATGTVKTSIAARIEANSFSGSKDGAAVQTDASGTIPGSETTVQLGGRGSSADATEPLSISSVVIVPRGWTDAELIAKTT